jgi:UDP-glucose:(heptosyl)LPS alpha-1,3-glucosyltransferase
MELFPPIINQEDYKFEKPVNSKQVLFIGRLDRGKGVEDAILAIKHSKVGKLVILGEGPYGEEFELLVLAEGLEDRVEFKGKQPVDQMVEEIYRSDIVLAPFRRAEPMPRIISETFACGRGIIITDACGGSEYVKNGVNGYVVPVGDVTEMGRKIEYALTDKELLRKLGENGRSTFEKRLHPYKIMKKYKNLLWELEKK